MAEFTDAPTDKPIAGLTAGVDGLPTRPTDRFITGQPG